MISMMREKAMPYRILSLNGGGVRALLQAHFLNFVSQKEGVGNFWNQFDLIIGTSAGAIVAAALQAGQSPKDIAELFEKTADKIFPTLMWKGRFVLGRVKIGKSLSRKPLKEELQKVYEEKKLGDFKNPALAITATEIERGRIRVFSPLTAESDESLSLVDVVMASTALPGAFGHYSIKDPDHGDKRHYIDGGLWANAPMLPAVVLAVQNGVSLENIRVVSLGTASSTVPWKPSEYSKVKVLSKNFFRCLFDIASSAAEETSYEAVGRLIGRENILHVDGLTQKQIKAWDVDKAIKALPGVAKGLANDKSVLNQLEKLIAS